MTAEFESMAELLLVILTITCIVQGVFVGLLLWYVKKMSESLNVAKAAAAAPLSPAPGPEPAPAMGPGVEEELPAAPVAPAPVVPAAIAPVPVAPAVDILEGSPDIEGSIHRLSEKYDLSDFIITTLDGLVVVSLHSGSSEEAARFSDLYRRKKRPDSPGVTFLPISHRGEAMLGIARSGHPLLPEQTKGIVEDARKILHWWL
jgi:hypothetical protein